MKKQFIISTFNLTGIRPPLPIPGSELQPGGRPFNSMAAPDDYSMSTARDDSTIYSAQLLGVPVWADILLQEEKENGLELQILQVLITATMKKNIVKTAVQGRNGTVKEYISDGDYQLQIMGAFCDANPNRYPIEDVNTLVKLCKLPEALVLVSKFAQIFSIYNIVVEDYDFPQKQGYQNMQAFTIRAVSDDPIQLKEIND